MAAIASAAPSSDVYTNALLGSYKWASGSLTYSFPTSYTQYGANYGSSEPLNNFEGLNATQQNVVRAAFTNFAAVANVTFTELTGSNAANATLRLAMSDEPSTAWAYMPHTAGEGGDAWFNNSGGYYDNPRLGNYAYTTFLHEIGHALGLEHPHENNMPIERDSMEYSVMSYRAYVEAPLTGYTNESWGFARTLMMQDIAALQHLYGANFSTNSGNTTYSWSPTTGQMSINGVGQGIPGGNRIFQTVWDGGGVDTYDFSNYTTNLSIDLRPGGWSTLSSTQLARLHWSGSQVAEGNIASALQYRGDARSLIEDVVGGSGSDKVVGNDTDNRLSGGFGNDILYGLDGDDTLTGGAGSDTFVFMTPGHGADNVMDFATGVDRFWIGSSGFGAGAGTLASANIAFILEGDTIGAGPAIIYHRSSGELWWDRDGSGQELPVHFASLPVGSNAVLGTMASAKEAMGAADFNGDGTDDLLWRDPTSGETVIWFMNNGQHHSSVNFGPSSTSWKVAGLGDFNGDGTDDILWRNVLTGEIAQWFMKQGELAGSMRIQASVNTWQVSGVGDFDGDRTDDILWKNSESGHVLQWYMSKGELVGWSFLSASTNVWEVAGVGDFNDDGTDDVLWHNSSSGSILQWHMLDRQLDSWSNMTSLAPTWSAAVGHVGGDLADDIVWLNSDTREVVKWIVSNRTIVGTESAGHVDGKFAALGDFDADNEEELVWVNSSDQVLAWGDVDSVVAPPVEGTDWMLV